MLKVNNVLKQITQHDKLNILLYTEKGCPLTERQSQLFCGPKRTFGYSLLYITHGCATCFVDEKSIDVKSGQLLCVVPHQIYFTVKGGTDYRYFKLVFDEDCLALLPGAYSFWTNLAGDPVISIDDDTSSRVLGLLQMLHGIITTQKLSSEMILSYLHPLLSEFERLHNKRKIQDVSKKFNVQQFQLFKNIVEREFKNQCSIAAIAEEMALTADSLNRLVQGIAGMSPKEYITRRIMLEAKRMLYHHQLPVKELAYLLGFSDPDYFSRFFKRHEGLGLSEYKKKMQELSS